jgi:hypothetical protein
MLRAWLCVLMVCCAFSAAGGAPVQWSTSAGGNGHYYEFVLAENIKWTDARLAAQGRSFGGVNGYLATATSQPESDFLLAHFPERAGGDQNGWLGGYQDTTAPDYSEPAGGWRWVSGEPWIYTNWYAGIPQPDNDGGDQHYIRSNTDFQWDDLMNDPINDSIQFVSGYFVEYAVPEPGALAAVAVGAALLRRNIWRRTRGR